MIKFSPMVWLGYFAMALSMLFVAGCDQGQRPVDIYGSGSSPPMPKIAVGEFGEYPAPGFPANGRQMLLDALRSQLQEQGMLWEGGSDPRIDLTGSLQAYEGRYATPADDSVVVDLSGELRDGGKVMVKSQVNRRVRPGSDWNVEIGQMAEQLLNDLRAKVSVQPSTTGVSGTPGYYGYPAYGAGTYYPPSYYYGPYGSYYMYQPYYYGYYGPGYLNMYWLSYYWWGRPHHHHHHPDQGGPPGGPRPRPQPIPPGVSQSIPRTHPDGRRPPSFPADRRPGPESVRDALPRSHDEDRLAPRPSDGRVPAAPQDFGSRGRPPQTLSPGTLGIPRSQRPSSSDPSFMRPESRQNSMDIPRRPTFSSPPTRFAPPTSTPSFRPPRIQSAPAAPPASRPAPFMRGGGGRGFGGMAPGSQRRRR